jgi:hypothetical protein
VRLRGPHHADLAATVYVRVACATGPGVITSLCKRGLIVSTYVFCDSKNQIFRFKTREATLRNLCLLETRVGHEMAAHPALPLPTQDLLETGTMIAPASHGTRAYLASTSTSVYNECSDFSSPDLNYCSDHVRSRLCALFTRLAVGYAHLSPAFPMHTIIERRPRMPISMSARSHKPRKDPFDGYTSSAE